MLDSPPGATLDPNTGVFRWVPAFDSAPSYTVRFRASDGETTTEQAVTFTVLNVNVAPVFDPFASVSVLENETLALQLVAFDPDNPHYQPQVLLANGTLSGARRTADDRHLRRSPTCPTARRSTR